MSRIEELLTALTTGGSIENYTPQSRIEQILVCCINKHGVEHCEPAQSVNEVLLQTLAEQIKEGANVPVEVETAAEMDALLVADNVGKAYIYTGETTGNYNTGDIYIVTEEE